MGYIDHFTEFLFDEKRRLSAKAAVVVFVVLAIFVVDNIFGFSYSYTIDRKIEQVQKLNSMAKDSSLDDRTRAFAFNLRSEVINRKNLFNKFLSNLNNTSNITARPKPPSTSKNVEIYKRNNFWFALSAGGIYFLLAIVVTPLMFFSDRTTSVFQRLATGITTAISFVLFGMFFIWLLGLIPRISNSTLFWNYAINLIIQTGIISLLGYVGVKKSKM